MIINRYWILLLFLSLHSPLMGQLIEWAPQFELRPEHFKAMPDTASDYAAVTSSGPDVFYHTIGDDYFVDSVKTVFHCNKSWIKKDEVSSRLITHEKLHFDIAELLIRKLRISYDSLENEGIYQKDIYDNLLELNQLETRIMHQKYDRETGHGKHGLEQEKWNKLIRDKLNLK